MKTKPCSFEQELLFSLHRMGAVWERMKIGWHCLFCPDCRRRRAEFAAASKALMTLRPSSVAMSAAVPGTRRTRLIMCSAALAIAAAVLSYYLTVMEHTPKPAVSLVGPVGTAKSCAPVITDDIQNANPKAVKGKFKARPVSR